MHRRPFRPRLFAAALTAALAVTAAAATATTGYAAAAGCRVAYTVSSQWSGGFTANVAVTNLGDPISGWTLRWSFTAGQSVSQAWNAAVTQSGSAVTAVNAGWNGSLATNGSATFGFNGGWNNSANPVPASFTLNGVTCTGAVGPTGSPTVAPTTTPPTTAPPGVPPERTVRVYWLKPTDVAYDQRYPDGIANVMREAQRYYRQELGRTFTLNNPVVEVVNGDHPRSWYENTPNGNECYWWVVFNMQQELMRKLSLRAPDPRWINVGEISAEASCSGGGGGGGWVILSGHDADGGAGINGPMNRWYGGMVHELGHAFGLPDSTSTDGTPMSASFYDYPNTHFSQAQKDRILSGPYGAFLS
ncbi:cellulose-binding domain-containing protein [Phytohabitans sp. ZYX-F-186]|uniref:Cellulose-binding domain-containing protein n=1 Tax=Phytohabitans maris TaxID=3071409 RepID=A0ABU0ZMG6_9ACTN|nr:cellulose-binding domain-containing protein [Phytohabitans sp. ZYX-F-186]MDQ7908236.1 cellulose-binding domain-containing protein [Phytohabitans sp. ZYX-F-186]